MCHRQLVALRGVQSRPDKVGSVVKTKRDRVSEEDLQRWCEDAQWHHIHPYTAYNINVSMLMGSLVARARRDGLALEYRAHRTPGILSSCYAAGYIDFRFLAS